MEPGLQGEGHELFSYTSDRARLLGELSQTECVEQLVESWLLGGWSPDSSSDGSGGRKTTKNL